MLPKTDDWLQIVGLKVKVLKHFLNNFDHHNFAFFDIDCYLRYDVSEVFKEEFDIAVTRMFKKISASAGLWFAKKTVAIENFANKWENLQNEFFLKKKGIVKHLPSYSQLSFSELAHQGYQKNKGELKVLPISVDVYNCEDNDKLKLIQKIQKFDSKIIHFKGRSWRDENLMNQLKNLKIIQ
jgi:hypothetical protein